MTTPPPQSDLPTLSFVVPAHNEELLLPATLASIDAAAQDVDATYEIVVASDASTDATVQVAQQAGARVVEVDLRQIAAVRNAGAAASTGERLIFVDADTLVNAQLIEATLAAFDAGVVGGGCEVKLEGKLPLWSKLAMLTFGFVYSRVKQRAAGCYVFATRQAFDAVGGFDQTLYAAEEIAISQALKRQGKFVVLRESVRTSGRKIRTWSFLELLGLLGRYVWRGKKAFQQRQGLDVWYGPRREDTPR